MNTNIKKGLVALSTAGLLLGGVGAMSAQAASKTPAPKSTAKSTKKMTGTKAKKATPAASPSASK